MKRLKCVYFITGITPSKFSDFANEDYVKCQLPLYDNDINATHLNMHTFLWLPTYEEAENFVLNNVADISEGGSCRWMVIEGIEPKYCNVKATPQVFFKWVGDYWTDDTSHYEKIDGWPEVVKNHYERHHIVPILASIG